MRVDAMRRFVELKIEQHQRVTDHIFGAIHFSKQYVTIPAHDFGVVAEALAESQRKLIDAEWRATVLETIEKMKGG